MWISYSWLFLSLIYLISSSLRNILVHAHLDLAVGHVSLFSSWFSSALYQVNLIMCKNSELSHEIRFEKNKADAIGYLINVFFKNLPWLRIPGQNNNTNVTIVQ